jgi:hypothetical protein
MSADAMTNRLLVQAQARKPALAERPVLACDEVRVVADPNGLHGWRAERVGPAAGVLGRTLKAGDSFVLDFGEHRVGYLHLDVEPVGPADAPVRFKLVFGEVPAEIAEDMDAYVRGAGGSFLSRNWLQDEMLTIDFVPVALRLPRRYAFRYLKVTLVDASHSFDVKLTAVRLGQVSAVDMDKAPALPERVPAGMRQLDEVGRRTLANCMQSVFEDGPKRDRRLWLGDLRLQALANYETFRDFPLIERCLYLFAAFPREDKLVAACIYEFPEPHIGHCHILDYAALFGPAVLDYLEAGGARTVALDLWPTVKNQLGILKYVGADGLFVDPGNWWIFFDWQNGLDKTSAMHAMIVYMLRQTWRLAEKLGKTAEVAEIPERIATLTKAAQARLWDAGKQVFVSGAERQVSYATQAWMVLAGIATPEQGRAALRAVAKNAAAVKPAGPYLWHYVLEAMLLCGLEADARKLLEHYWGAMVALGATTFWEVFDPANTALSPYGSHLINSYCHAWSCTPSYFIRHYPAVFQA